MNTSRKKERSLRRHSKIKEHDESRALYEKTGRMGDTRSDIRYSSPSHAQEKDGKRHRGDAAEYKREKQERLQFFGRVPEEHEGAKLGWPSRRTN